MEKGFFQQVYDVALQIPYGKVTSYGAIAEYLGSKGSARMVGWAMNSSKNLPQNLPAHRVVNRNGLLTGKQHFGGKDIMADLLRSEGLIVEENKIIDFDKYFWDPSLELKM
ncbi:MAG: cysteine methyltransferase [Bacteroidetes bacterium]|nr:cysteine methyltransferase [Bacteroidota bacterium]|tara:strand:- start:79 stop:411 length:333 start_codon:yes stop_codon:yes gene_type:complete